MQNHARPLGDWFGQSNHVAGHVGFHRQVAHSGLASEDQQGRVPLFRLPHGPECVCQTGHAVNLHEPGAAAGARVAIGRHDGHGLLITQNVAQPIPVVGQRVEEALFLRPGQTEHMLEAVGDELLQDRVVAVHPEAPSVRKSPTIAPQFGSLPRLMASLSAYFAGKHQP